MPLETMVEERRSRTSDTINKLLAERQQLLVSFCRVAGLEPYTLDKSLLTLLREFCQVLVDYVATVHFELYTRIDEGTERRAGVTAVAEQVYSRIAETTEMAVDFNDKYEVVNQEKLAQSLSEDLSSLGQVFASRFELEDRLFTALLERR